MSQILSISNIDVSYGPVKALFDVSASIEDGEIVSIIGANGAGKSTLMKAIMNLAHVGKGQVIFQGRTHFEDMATDKIVKCGVAYVPEGRKIFPQMTVAENLEMGAYSRRIPHKVLLEGMDECYSIFPRLKERRTQEAGTLSGGEQQMVAIARGLMTNPKLLMLDEPSMGLAPIIVEEMFNTISQINKTRQMPILLVEQNAFMALRISNSCYVLENGRVTLKGSSEALRTSDEVKKKYLGG